VASAYDFAEQLLATQRKFAEDLLKAAAPLMPGRAESTSATETYKPGEVVPRDGTVECARQHLTLDKVAADLTDRLISIFTPDADGRRACFGGTAIMRTDPAWHGNLIFSEYFHGDNGAAIGAFHQTGWTGVVADLIRRRHGAVEALGDVLRRVESDQPR
jgi:hypothetical protein